MLLLLLCSTTWFGHWELAGDSSAPTTNPSGRYRGQKFAFDIHGGGGGAAGVGAEAARRGADAAGQQAAVLTAFWRPRGLHDRWRVRQGAANCCSSGMPSSSSLPIYPSRLPPSPSPPMAAAGWWWETERLSGRRCSACWWMVATYSGGAFIMAPTTRAAVTKRASPAGRRRLLLPVFQRLEEVTWQEALLLYKDTKRLVIWSCTRTLARGIGVVQPVMASSLLRNRGGCAILFLSTIFSDGATQEVLGTKLSSTELVQEDIDPALMDSNDADPVQEDLRNEIYQHSSSGHRMKVWSSMTTSFTSSSTLQGDLDDQVVMDGALVH